MSGSGGWWKPSFLIEGMDVLEAAVGAAFCLDQVLLSKSFPRRGSESRFNPHLMRHQSAAIAIPRFGRLSSRNPDPPILAFFISLLFSFSDLPCSFYIFVYVCVCVCVFSFLFARILGVPRREKPLLFSGFPSFFSVFRKIGRVGGSGKIRQNVRP